MSEEVQVVEVSKIVINPYQPRRHFAKDELEGLALSIKAVGLIHPPVVRALSPFRYELVSGERRYRACQMAGLTEMPVIVRASTPCLSAQAALIENVQRVDLNPMEIASSLSRLMAEFGFNQEELADKIGKKRSTLANYLRLLALPPPIQESIRANQISMGHAKAILSLDQGKQALLHELILRDHLSVRKAEERAHQIQKNKRIENKNSSNPSLHLDQVAEELQKKWGTRVTIQGTNNKGSLKIDYYSFDELEQILIALGLEER